MKGAEVNSQRLQVLLLRLVGSVEMLAFIAVAMPRAWMEAAHRWLGLGEMTGGVILMFMIRQASFTYGVHGALLWVMSSDVERFRPLVVFTGVSYLLAGPAFLVIDIMSGMPWFWVLGETLFCLCAGAAILWLGRGSDRMGEGRGYYVAGRSAAVRSSNSAT